MLVARTFEKISDLRTNTEFEFEKKLFGGTLWWEKLKFSEKSQIWENLSVGGPEARSLQCTWSLAYDYSWYLITANITRERLMHLVLFLLFPLYLSIWNIFLLILTPFFPIEWVPVPVPMGRKKSLSMIKTFLWLGMRTRSLQVHLIWFGDRNNWFFCHPPVDIQALKKSDNLNNK